MNEQRQGICPICRSNGTRFGGDGAALANHIENSHPVKDVVAALAIEAIRHRAYGDPVMAKCPAHGDTDCDLCSLNPADCASPEGPCSFYRDTGMHWDTCPNRIRTYEDAVKRLRELEATK